MVVAHAQGGGQLKPRRCPAANMTRREGGFYRQQHKRHTGQQQFGQQSGQQRPLRRPIELQYTAQQQQGHQQIQRRPLRIKRPRRLAGQCRMPAPRYPIAHDVGTAIQQQKQQRKHGRQHPAEGALAGQGGVHNTSFCSKVGKFSSRCGPRQQARHTSINRGPGLAWRGSAHHGSCGYWWCAKCRW